MTIGMPDKGASPENPSSIVLRETGTQMIAMRYSLLDTNLEYSDEFFDKEVFPYHLTGVIAGKWVREIVEPLFLRHGIALDFSVRGFYDRATIVRKRKNFFLRLIDRIRSL
jgi:hypothetical protein